MKPHKGPGNGPGVVPAAGAAGAAAGQDLPTVGGPVLLATVEGSSLSKSARRLRDEELTWPFLVYREAIALVLVSVLLWIASLLWNAPLEEMANPTLTPNPAKAPWYFLGLQELLVYFDPWIAGVMVPLIIIVGLMLVPYLDPGRQGAGAYQLRARRFAATVFLGGLFLWFLLIVIGVYFRGQSWAWYWPWEDASIPKPTTAITRDLSPYVGWPAVILYFAGGLVLPALVRRRFYKALGPGRYVVVQSLLLLMTAVPLKIALRLVFDVKYVLVTRWFNI